MIYMNVSLCQNTLLITKPTKNKNTFPRHKKTSARIMKSQNIRRHLFPTHITNPPYNLIHITPFRRHVLKRRPTDNVAELLLNYIICVIYWVHIWRALCTNILRTLNIFRQNIYCARYVTYNYISMSYFFK